MHSIIQCYVISSIEASLELPIFRQSFKAMESVSYTEPETAMQQKLIHWSKFKRRINKGDTMW